MSLLDDLISVHCPAGVPFVPLGQVAKNHDNVRKPVTKHLRVTGQYPYYGANGVQDYVDDFLLDGTYLLLGEDGSVMLADGTPVVNWANGKIWVNNHAHVLSELPDGPSLRFFFQFLQTVQISHLVTGSAQPKLNQANMNRIRVPVPPVEVQSEIVRILDKFTALEAELEAELESRKKQYAQYRRGLLQFDIEDKGIDFARLGLVANFANAKAHERVVDPDGEIALLTSRFISTQGRKARYVNRADVKTPALKDQTALVMSDLPNGRALARAFYIEQDDKYAANQRVCLIDPIDVAKLLPRFLYYILDRNPQLLKYDSGVDQTHLSKDQILGVLVPMPPVDEQKRIVEILDKFELLVNDLSIGLPAELNARRKQYEYYRERLLTFKELEA